MQRTSCSACGAKWLHKFLDLGDSPVADAYTSTADEYVDLHPLQVAVCERCYLVQLLEVLDSQTLFGTGYSFYSSASMPLQEYHLRYARELMDRFPNPRRVIEVGCNDGDMLRWFTGYDRLGIDPAEGPANVARSRELEVLGVEFNSEVAKQVREDGGPADLLIANHVLAHVPDVADFLLGIHTLLGKFGVATVEVQYLPDLLVNNAFDLVYHEHRNFFSLTSLTAAARRQGLRIFEAELTSRQGGSLRVKMDREDTGQHLVKPSVPHLRETEWWLNYGPAAYDGVQGRAERMRDRLLQLLHESPHPIGGYGAPAKATTLLHFCSINVDTLTFVADTTPAKQGRFIPGTGIPIVSPDYLKPPSTYLLLAWNYMHDIVRRYPSMRWIVPVPAPTLL